MRMRTGLALSALLLLVVSCTSRTGGSISVNGNMVEIKDKDLLVRAIKGATEEGTYVLMSASAINNPDILSYLDGRLTILPKEDYDRLMKIRSAPGDVAREQIKDMRKRLRRMTVIAEDGPTQKKIKEIIAKTPRDKHPMLKITMTELRVIELKHKGNPVYLSGDAGKNYLVSMIKVL